MNIKKVLVTGSSGTVGTRLCEILLKRGYDVTGVDIVPNRWNNDVNKITLVGDLRDSSFFERLDKFDLVIHLAAHARVYNSVVNPQLSKDNFDMVFNVMEFVRKNGIKKVFFASSREVYGNTPGKTVHKEEDAIVTLAESPYSATKLAAEAFVHSYKECYGIDFVILRLSNVYGMYDESDRVVPLFIRLINENKDVTVFGEKKLLDFTYIDDTIDGFIKCIENFDKVKNNTFNIASGVGTKILDVAKIVQKKLGKDIKIEIRDTRTGEVMEYIADVSKIKKFVDYSPKTPIEDGIEKAIEWFKKQNSK